MSSECSPELRERIEYTLRFLAIDAVNAANSGHIGAPIGLATPVFELFDQHLEFDPSDADWPLRDRFVLSGGHASMLLYGLLHLFGYDLSLDEIERFRQLGSRTAGHPEFGELPGVEVTTGPLGQGFAHAVGMALAGRMTRSHFDAEGSDGRGPGSHFVYGVMGDGDLMEGVCFEAASLAGHLGLGNLIFLYDDNAVTIDGGTALSFSEDVRGRFEAQGWHVQAVDGQDVPALRGALAAAREERGRPSLVITRTLIGRGTAVEGRNKAHGWSLAGPDIIAAKQAVGWPVDEPFHIPADVAAYVAERAAAKRQGRLERDAAHQAWRAAQPERAAAWDAARNGKLPENLAALLCEGMEGVAAATRIHSGNVLQRLSEIVPNTVGGSADLAGSAAPPLLAKAGSIGPAAETGADPFGGRNLHFGVREHAMVSVTNGIALDGTFIPYCGTFLIFSDYARPAIRLAALMKLRSIYVFTHDSYYVGEDGPTHQPVEQVDSLRAIPGLTVFRPSDGVETAMAYAWALQKAHGPVALALTRQGVAATPRKAGFDPSEVWKGAYVVRDAEGATDVVIMASGSEVALSCEAAGLLAEQGVQARIVSVPCMELFLAQDEADQETVVPDDGTPVVAVEAGVAESYRRFVGRKGLVIGMNRFGASAPGAQLADYFGFTPEKVAARILEHLGRSER